MMINLHSLADLKEMETLRFLGLHDEGRLKYDDGGTCIWLFDTPMHIYPWESRYVVKVEKFIKNEWITWLAYNPTEV